MPAARWDKSTSHELIESKEAQRDSITEDIQRFLANGGEVQKLAHGASGMPDLQEKVSKAVSIARQKQIRHRRMRRPKKVSGY